MQYLDPEHLASDPEFLAELYERIREVYRSREATWVVAYSGGRNATAVLQIIWKALLGLEAGEQTNPIHVVNVTTGVDSWVAQPWVEHSLLAIEQAAEQEGLPIRATKLRRELADSFWIKLLGWGYAAPQAEYMWCAQGLKRRPLERYIRKLRGDGQDVTVVLGTRSRGGLVRSRALALRDASTEAVGAYSHAADALQYTPLLRWDAADVDYYLRQRTNPWGLPNPNLLNIYRDAQPPADTDPEPEAPMCGDCRVGCWICTVFTRECSFDQLMDARPDLYWLRPLVELRDELSEDRSLVRSPGESASTPDRPRYTRRGREYWLRRVLQAQLRVDELLPDDESVDVISADELREIQRIWRLESPQMDDRLQSIYRQVFDRRFVDDQRDESGMLPADRDLLRSAFRGDDISFELSRSLLEVERRHRTMLRRAGIYEELADVFGHRAPSDLCPCPPDEPDCPRCRDTDS